MRAFILAGLVAVTGCSASAKADDKDDKDKADEAEAPIKVTCAPALRSTTADHVVVRGIIAAPPSRQATVAPSVPGRIAEVLVQEGQVVERGAVLAVIDDPTLVANLGESEAQVTTARAAEVAATKGAERAHRLLDEGIAPRRDVEDADAKAAQASAELRAAQARRELASAQRDRSRVKAPIAGTVVRIFRRAGELVDGTPQTPVAEVADPTHLELRADAPAGDLVRLRPGLFSQVRLDAVRDQSLAGRVLAVSPGVDPATTLGWVRIALDVPQDAPVVPRLGLAGQAEILVGARAGLIAVPASAVRRGSEGRTEVLLCGEVARVAVVTVAGRAGDTVLLAGGVEAGAQVIVDHVLNLEDGAKISAARER
jgi:RND family efflux transporter MFP subunit